jgi:hypothetical protein
MSKYLYLAYDDKNKIEYFYLIDFNKKQVFSGIYKISNHVDSISRLKELMSDYYFIKIPIDDEKFNLFLDFRISELRKINYKNFLKTYDLYEWAI